MKPGDKLYRVWNGVLETYVIGRIVRKTRNGETIIRPTHSNCELGVYNMQLVPTELEAWEQYEEECRNCLPQLEKELEELKEDVHYVRKQIDYACDRIGDLQLEETK